MEYFQVRYNSRVVIYVINVNKIGHISRKALITQIAKGFTRSTWALILVNHVT